MIHHEPDPFHDFKAAVLRRLGLDPDEVSLVAWRDDGGVDVRFHLPVDEIYALLKANGAKWSPFASVGGLLDAMVAGTKSEWHVDERGALRSGSPVAEWEREFLAQKEIEGQLRKTNETLDKIAAHLDKMGRAAKGWRSQAPGGLMDGAEVEVVAGDAPVARGRLVKPVRNHMFATYEDGTLAYCSCGKTDDLERHAFDVLPPDQRSA